MTNEEAVNTLIKSGFVDSNKISDGYHTFEELYEHRCRLFIALCSVLNTMSWRSTKHYDGSSYEGWFILGLYQGKGSQITYHIPMRMWVDCLSIPICDPPPYDGHTSNDVIERLKLVAP